MAHALEGVNGDRYEVNVFVEDTRDLLACVLELIRPSVLNGDQYQLKLRLPVSGECLSAKGHDSFFCLRRLRLKLEARRMRVLVQGARREFWVTGMGSQMGGGLKGILMRLGPPLGVEHDIEIFDPVGLDQVVPVAEQHDYAGKWWYQLLHRNSGVDPGTFEQDWAKQLARLPED